MKKLLALLVAGAFAGSAFAADASGMMSKDNAKMDASAMKKPAASASKQSKKRHHGKKHHHKAAAATTAPAA